MFHTSYEMSRYWIWVVDIGLVGVFNESSYSGLESRDLNHLPILLRGLL